MHSREDEILGGGLFLLATVGMAGLFGAATAVAGGMAVGYGTREWTRKRVPQMTAKMYEHRQKALWDRYNRMPEEARKGDPGRRVKTQIRAVEKKAEQDTADVDFTADIMGLGAFACPPLALAIPAAEMLMSRESRPVETPVRRGSERNKVTILEPAEEAEPPMGQLEVIEI